MRTALICHHDNPLNRDVLPRFMASFSDLAGVVVIRERPGRMKKRLMFEWRRSRLRMLDVFAFRLYYKLRLARRDRAWIARRVADGVARYPAPPTGVPVHETDDPNSEATRAFLEQVAPDLVIARCKTILRPEVFEVPRLGTYVVHPGICPEYRNAHGCFWALARRDLDRVGATLLRIDAGVDTGPIYDYFKTDIDERSESHIVIQHRVVFDNLDRLADDIRRIDAGTAERIDVSGRESAAWGQPRLTDYLHWKRAARRTAAAAA
jgi:folate-dependent phosphoribosylglycinamide formyltransferase PurN